jgi:diguanylate cyclase (GGDEF)-like protein
MARKKAKSAVKQALNQEDLLNRIAKRIRQSLELQEILSTTVQEVKSLLKTARVKIYRFEPDGSGEVIAESRDGDRLPSLLGLRFPAEDIPPQARAMFIEASQRVLVDVTAQRKMLNNVDCPETNEIATADIRYLPVDPCHLEYLSNMGVISSLVLPILHQHQLWGLLVAHNVESRRFSERELKVVQLLVDHVSIAIAQSNLLSQARQQASREATLNRISRLLHSSVNIADIKHTVLQVSVEALQGSGGRLYVSAYGNGQTAQLYTCGNQPTLAWLEEKPCWQQLMGLSNTTFIETDAAHQAAVDSWNLGASEPVWSKADADDSDFTRNQSIPRVYSITDLYQEPQLQSLVSVFEPTRIRSILIVPLHYRQHCVGCLTIFRNEINTETLWAGRWEQDERNLRPRRSFEAWREIKKGQAQAWSLDDVKLGQSLGTHLYIAVMQKRVEYTIRHQASHDQLTGLPNRLLFYDRLSLALANAQRKGDLLAVMFLDLDRFKLVNDTLGHAAGDQLLQLTAQRLRGCLRQGDTLARWAGDEFTMLFPQLSSTSVAAKIAQKILNVLIEPFNIEQQELYIKASIGIAFAPYDGEDAQTLLKNADAAMYQTKQQGKNNYQTYAPNMNVKARERLVLENNLHKAVERDEFLLYYQPQVNLNTGQIVGVEALIRWQRDGLGLIAPDQFISLAEETGLIISIGEWVLRTACAQSRTWQLAGLPPLRTAVNLSARQFQQGNLVQTIAQVLTQTELEPQYLELEITESIVIQDVDFTISVLQELKKMGIQISIDDFGTGYSSLSSLRYFPVDTLKIDQSFIQNLTTNSSNVAIIKSIIALGHGLNLKVIAEGVETAEQMQFLRSVECDDMQGYFISRPLPPETATQFCIQHALERKS